jgi:NADPH:quinone reductase-like Zn-dependent oxidoreductase
MKAVVIRAYGGPDVLKYEDYPEPVAGQGEVLVRVAASSVNPFDLKIRSGSMKDFVPFRFPGILGVDVSGTVQAVGPGVTAFRVGDKVFAQTMQAYAELCVVKASDLARIPEGMRAVEVAALPTVTTTGAQLAEFALNGVSHPCILVTGAAGNVGRSAVYAAKEHGATVIAGVLTRHLDHARAIGADAVMALDDEQALESLDTVDAVADTVAGPVAARLIGKIKAGGTFASVLGPPENASAYPSVRLQSMQVRPAPATLLQMAEAVKAGELAIPLGQRFALKDAGNAHAASEAHAAGKLLLIA